MIIGSINIPQVVDRSRCRTCEDYYLTSTTDYKVHSTALMTTIPFERAKVTTESIDSSIFLNSGVTKLTFAPTVKSQNYLTTHYVGRIPFEEYTGPPTPSGTEFELICRGGNPNKRNRYFGTDDTIIGDDRGTT